MFEEAGGFVRIIWSEISAASGWHVTSSGFLIFLARVNS